MPRIYNAENEPLDFCKRHFPSKIAAERTYPGCDHDAPHPDYAGIGYECEVCNRPLTEKDD